MTWEPDSCVLRRLSAERARRCLADVGPVFFVGDSVTRYQYLALLHFLVAGKYQNPYDTDRSLTNAHKHKGDSVTQFTSLWKHAKSQVRRHGPEGSSLSYRIRRLDDIEQAHLRLPAPGGNGTVDVLFSFTKGASASEYEDFYAWVSKHVNQLTAPSASAASARTPASTSALQAPVPATNASQTDAAVPAPTGPATRTAGAPVAAVVGNATVTPEPEVDSASLEGLAPAAGGGEAGTARMEAGSVRRIAGEDGAGAERPVASSAEVSEAGAQTGGAGSSPGAPTSRPPGPIPPTPLSESLSSRIAAPPPPAAPTLGTAPPRPQPQPAAQSSDSPTASRPSRALVILNVCAHYGASPAWVPDVKAALAAARDKLPPGTQVVWRSCTTPGARNRRVIDAAEPEIAAFAARIGVPVLDLRGVSMSGVRQGLVTTWSRDTVHFHQWMYGEFNDILFNVLCPPEPEP